MYVVYYMIFDFIIYGGEGVLCYLYFVILLSYIFLLIVVIFFVFIIFVRVLNGNIEMYKKIVCFIFLIWLYVVVSGVIVYLMIFLYY